jgi:hypothetical protein
MNALTQLFSTVGWLAAAPIIGMAAKAAAIAAILSLRVIMLSAP